MTTINYGKIKTADRRRAAAFTRSTPRISALLSYRFLLGWWIGLRCSATEPTSGVAHEKEYNNSGDKNPQPLVLKEFHELFLPSGK